jgi:hypothetical protein
MPEILPGNPTEAGPDTHKIDEPEPDWDDLMCFAREELQFAQTRYRANTYQDRRQLILAIMRAKAFLDSAKDELKKMEINRAR